MHHNLYCSGSQPGILYGLPKIRKAIVPMRPTLSAIGNTGYNISKFLLSHSITFSTNEFKVPCSFSVLEQIHQLQTV